MTDDENVFNYHSAPHLCLLQSRRCSCWHALYVKADVLIWRSAHSAPAKGLGAWGAAEHTQTCGSPAAPAASAPALPGPFRSPGKRALPKPEWGHEAGSVQDGLPGRAAAASPPPRAGLRRQSPSPRAAQTVNQPCGSDWLRLLGGDASQRRLRFAARSGETKPALLQQQHR